MAASLTTIVPSSVSLSVADRSEDQGATREAEPTQEMGMTDPNLAFIQLFEDLKSEINRRAGKPRSPSLELD